MAAHNSKWRDEHYVTAFRLAQDGLTEHAIAQAMGATQNTFDNWKKKHPALKAALEQGRHKTRTTDQPNSQGVSADTFSDYVYRQLPEHLQMLWEEIMAAEKARSGIERIQALLARAGLRGRQHLLLHAIVASNFSISEALRRCCLTRAAFNKWCTTDPDFAAIVDEIHWHKKNFFESRLVQLAKAGEASVVIFANKTLNKDRGFNEKVDISLDAKGLGKTPIGLDQLNLPPDVLRLMLERTRQVSGEEGDHEDGGITVPVPRRPGPLPPASRTSPLVPVPSSAPTPSSAPVPKRRAGGE